MPFSFLMTSVLGAAALAGLVAVIPLIVHLLHRQKVTPIAWGAMQFLLESPLKVKRRRKIDNWLLMLVRMAILMLLVFLLCRPALKLKELSTSSPVDVAVVIDHSMTMGTRAAGDGPGGNGASKGTLFDQGVDIAERVSKMLPASGTMSIVLAEHSPRVVTPVPVKMGLTERGSDGTPHGKWADALHTLRTMKPGMTKGNMAPAVAVARDLLAHGSNTRKVILVVSDDQRTNWGPGDEALWKMALGNVEATDERSAGTGVYSYPVGTSQASAAGAPTANVSVRGVTVMPAFLGVHRPSQILATVANSGSLELTNVPLQLLVDGRQVATDQVASLAPGESRTIRFDYYFPQAGSHWVKVQADMVDALEADNSATAAVNVWPKLPVLVVDGQLTRGADFPAAAFLQMAMQPVDPTIDPVTLIEPKIISVSELSSPEIRLESYPIVVLNDVPRLTLEMTNKLAARAQAGNGVWVILGPRTEQSFINDVLLKSQLAPISARGIAHAPRAAEGVAAVPVAVDVKEPANGALALMTAGTGGGGEHSALAEVTMRAWWSVTPVVPEMRTVLATTSAGGAGEPLVMEMDLGKLGGRVVVWTTPVGDLEWNNFPLMGASFVPLVNETLFHLASGQDAGQPRQVDAGAPIVWTGPSSQPIESVTLVRPDGSTRTPLPELRADHYYVADDDTALPGLYEMRFSAPAKAGAIAPSTAYFSVNIDRAELDPAVLSVPDMDWFKEHKFLKGAVTAQTLAKAMDATQGGYELWWALGLLLLGFLVLEVFMTYRLTRHQSGAMLEAEGLGGVMPVGVVTK